MVERSEEWSIRQTSADKVDGSFVVPNPISFQACVHGNQIILRGRLDAAALLAFDASVEQALAVSNHVVLDLAAVTFIDVDGLRGLVELCDSVVAGGSMTLRDPTPDSACLLRRTGFGDHLTWSDVRHPRPIELTRHEPPNPNRSVGDARDPDASGLDTQPNDARRAGSERELQRDLDGLWVKVLSMWRDALHDRDDDRISQLVEAAHALVTASSAIRRTSTVGRRVDETAEASFDGGIPCPLAFDPIQGSVAVGDHEGHGCVLIDQAAPSRPTIRPM
jgi:anti-anti-sigma factor